jgi:hypothetical protein
MGRTYYRNVSIYISEEGEVVKYFLSYKVEFEMPQEGHLNDTNFIR